MKYAGYFVWVWFLLMITGVNAGVPVFQYTNQFDANWIHNLTAKPGGPVGVLPASGVSSVTKFYPLNLKYSDPVKMKDAIKSIYPDVLVAIDERARVLIINTNENQIKAIESLVSRLDCPLPQIKIEVQIIELNYTNFNQYKNLFSELTNGFSINYNFQTGQVVPSNIDGVLVHLLQSGQAKLLAKPTISTQDNHRSTIRVGDRVPYIIYTTDKDIRSSQVNFLDTGIELEILPQVSSGDCVVADISTAISSVKVWKEFKDLSYPILSTRKTQTKVSIGNKKTLIIAGLMNEETQSNVTKVPLLSDLALIGDLFKGKIDEKVQSDIIFLITPEIF